MELKVTEFKISRMGLLVEKAHIRYMSFYNLNSVNLLDIIKF
jgi:hypothetical protein